MPQDLTDDKSTLVQVMAWCHRQQAITWASVDPDLWHHMTSLGHTELTHCSLVQDEGDPAGCNFQDSFLKENF